MSPFSPAPIQRFLAPIQRVLHVEAASGGVLLACTVVALLVANGPLAEAWQRFWDTPVEIAVGSLELRYPLWYWVNDGLMAVFFFVVGLEIKREVVSGELQDPRNVALPIAAAIGGALVPALVHVALRHGTPDAKGWAIPTATDIAFVVGCLALLGRRIPHGLKVLMLTVAVVDDLFAVVVIAFFYGGTPNAVWLGAAAVGVALVVALKALGVRSLAAYGVVGVFVWVATLKSGLHPTVAGAVLGLLTPARPYVGRAEFRRQVLAVRRALPIGKSGGEELAPDAYASLEFVAREARAPAERLHRALHPWVGFVIMPLFALANAGIPLGESDPGSAGAWAVAIGLVLGKPIGFLLGALLAVRTRLGRLPDGVTWGHLPGAGCLAGIGFTMSIFVASLSFEGDAAPRREGRRAHRVPRERRPRKPAPRAPGARSHPGLRLTRRARRPTPLGDGYRLSRRSGRAEVSNETEAIMAGIQDFIAMATSKLGVSKDAATGATAGLAGLIQKAAGADWGKLAAAIPGLGDLAGKTGGGGGGLGGMLGGLAQKAGGMFGGGGAAAGAVTSAGVPADKAPAFLSMFVDFVKSKVPPDVLKAVLAKVPGLGSLVG